MNFFYMKYKLLSLDQNWFNLYLNLIIWKDKIVNKSLKEE